MIASIYDYQVQEHTPSPLSRGEVSKFRKTVGKKKVIWHFVKHRKTL